MDGDKKTTEMRRFEYLVTIDTNAHVEDYERYRSVVLLTKNAVVFPSKINERVGLDGKRVTMIETTFKTLEDMEDQVIDKKFYDDLTGTFLPFMGFIPLIMTIGIVVLITALPFLFAGLALLYKLVESVFVFHVAWVFTVIFFVWMAYVLRSLGGAPIKKRRRAT